MAKAEQVALLKAGVKDWNEWLANIIYWPIDLSNAELSEARLRGVKLRLADLRDATADGESVSMTLLITHVLRRKTILLHYHFKIGNGLDGCLETHPNSSCTSRL